MIFQYATTAYCSMQAIYFFMHTCMILIFVFGALFLEVHLELFSALIRFNFVRKQSTHNKLNIHNYKTTSFRQLKKVESSIFLPLFSLVISYNICWIQLEDVAFAKSSTTLTGFHSKDIVYEHMFPNFIGFLIIMLSSSMFSNIQRIQCLRSINKSAQMGEKLCKVLHLIVHNLHRLTKFLKTLFSTGFKNTKSVAPMFDICTHYELRSQLSLGYHAPPIECPDIAHCGKCLFLWSLPPLSPVLLWLW